MTAAGAPVAPRGGGPVLVWWCRDRCWSPCGLMGPRPGATTASARSVWWWLVRCDRSGWSWLCRESGGGWLVTRDGLVPSFER